MIVWRLLNKRQRLLWVWGGGSAIAFLLLGVGVATVRRENRDAVPSVGLGVEGVTRVLHKEVGGDTASIRFEDVSAGCGIDFRHFPAIRESLLPEDMGSGVVIGDYDDDGLADVFMVNFAGSAIPGASIDPIRGKSRLYRNLGGFRFRDVTDELGLDFAGLGLGGAWGDYDSDGDLDLYIASYGDNALFRQDGDGRFHNATDAAGVQDRRFSAAASWADYDRDGDLDLYVCNYVDFVFRESDRGLKVRSSVTEEPYTVNPMSYPALPNALFRNRGDGTFEDVAVAAGVDNPTGKSLSASWVDFDNDGWSDLYVANDVSENGVFRNRRDGTFEDIGAPSLAADYRSAMGLAVADFDDDLDQDLVITHWLAQENALYRNMYNGGRGDPAMDRLWFMDVADQLGLGQIALDMVGWATSFADFDNDGRRDLWVVNGNTLEDASDLRRLRPQPAFIFASRPDGTFVDVAGNSCSRLRDPFVGRGGAQADMDNDGRIDLILGVHGGSPIALRNVSQPGGHWIRVQLRQAGGNTRALGGRAYLTADGVTRMAEVGASSSYLSQDELVVHFGLGAAAVVDSMRIVWPDSSEEVRERPRIDQTLILWKPPGRGVH